MPAKGASAARRGSGVAIAVFQPVEGTLEPVLMPMQVGRIAGIVVVADGNHNQGFGFHGTAEFYVLVGAEAERVEIVPAADATARDLLPQPVLELVEFHKAATRPAQKGGADGTYGLKQFFPESVIRGRRLVHQTHLVNREPSAIRGQQLQTDIMHVLIDR